MASSFRPRHPSSIQPSERSTHLVHRILHAAGQLLQHALKAHVDVWVIQHVF
jgi:hypothetical protein